MRRREVIVLLCGVARPTSAAAQDAGKVPRIGVLDLFPSSASGDFLEPFREGLAQRGYIDGRNIQVEYRSAEQSSDRAAELAADYVRQEVDIIIALATPSAHAAKGATSTIPILMNVSDPIATGLVGSLARPGANLTGTTTMVPSSPPKGSSCCESFVLAPRAWRFWEPRTIRIRQRSCKPRRQQQTP